MVLGQYKFVLLSIRWHRVSIGLLRLHLLKNSGDLSRNSRKFWLRRSCEQEKCNKRPSWQKFPLLIERQSCEREKVLFELFFQTLKPSARAELLLGAKSLNSTIKIISKKAFPPWTNWNGSIWNQQRWPQQGAVSQKSDQKEIILDDISFLRSPTQTNIMDTQTNSF